VKNHSTEKSKQRDLPINIEKKKTAEIYIDGASRGNPGSSAIGVLIIDSKGRKYEIKKYLGIHTNNQAEYRALIIALASAKKLRKTLLTIFTDSQLLANQVNHLWKVRDPGIKPLYEEALRLISSFKKVELSHIPRHLNKEADRLANEALDDYHS
jgi:ribonuclease HI